MRWSIMVFSTQSKIEKAQKVKGILNTFGVYDYTNDKMYTHTAIQQKQDQWLEQFIDFICDVSIPDMILTSKQYL